MNNMPIGCCSAETWSNPGCEPMARMPKVAREKFFFTRCIHCCPTDVSEVIITSIIRPDGGSSKHL
jgi:hypothetical protein